MIGTAGGAFSKLQRVPDGGWAVAAEAAVDGAISAMEYDAESGAALLGTASGSLWCGCCRKREPLPPAPAAAHY